MMAYAYTISSNASTTSTFTYSWQYQTKYITNPKELLKTEHIIEIGNKTIALTEYEIMKLMEILEGDGLDIEKMSFKEVEKYITAIKL